jgi:outer membrane lipoprotein-sorting protein
MAARVKFMTAAVARAEAGPHIGGVKRRALLLSVLAAPALAQGPNARDRADVARVEAYLNGLRTLKARFLQLAANGGTARGTVWLARPGRMRFEYDPPTPLLLVAGRGMFTFHDSALKQTSTVPVSRTPLGILLRDRASLSGDVTVTEVGRFPGGLDVSLVRTESPAEGTLTLVFADNPLALRQWRVVDAQRQETRVSLSDVQLGGSFDPKLFDFVDPNALRRPDGGGG